MADPAAAVPAPAAGSGAGSDSGAGASTAPSAGDAAPRRRHIHEPYPGLRPFLDHEHALLRGRDDQIRQVVERLERTHFVAIIGGSGSGKSSLIRAGVVPQLRSLAMPSAGDYWVPVVATPGTTKTEGARGQPPPPEAETPVSRLAWKFVQALKAQGARDVGEPLREEIAAFIRQGSGLQRLVDSYHHLLPAAGPPPDKARFLFVIDQFEELFHPNNRGNSDAQVVIDAVIDHFLRPGDRAFVVMTMRSEHLADCAAHLHLPDAINRSFYLVRRLNTAELRQVVVEPAQVMLRRLQRVAPDGRAEVVFEPEVVARLLADTRRIEDDPDHLPLLQHLLARLWSAALLREGKPARDAAPSAITTADLELAVRPDVSPQPGWLAAHRELNVLRRSLEHWAERSYLQRADADRRRIDELLTHLAFKDPNNGQYFQHRVMVDDPRLLSGEPAPRALLLRLLTQGFLDTVNYLHWDDENPAHVTLKVSHESFIRGWSRFRRVADREADRFDEFVTLMRRCGQWVQQERAPRALLEPGELARLQAAELDAVLDDPDRLRDWFKVLRLYRDGDRLSADEAALLPFIAASRERELSNARADAQRLQQAAAAREQAKLEEYKADRAHRTLARVGLATLALLLVTGYALLFIMPAQDRVDEFQQARALTETRERSAFSESPGAAQRELAQLVRAGRMVVQSHADMRRLPGGPDSWRQRWLMSASLARTMALADPESTVIGQLRQLLNAAVWTAPAAAGAPLALRQAEQPQACSVASPNDPAPAPQPGWLLPGPDAGHRLWAATPTEEDSELVLHSARLHAGGCEATRVFSVPLDLRPVLLLEDSAAAMALFTLSGDGFNLTLYAVDWRWRESAGGWVAQLSERRVVTDPAAEPVLERLQAMRGEQRYRVEVLPSRVVPGGVEIGLGEQRWRLLTSEARPLSAALGEPGWRRLQPAAAGSACAALAQADGPAPSPAARPLVLMDAALRLCFSLRLADAQATAGQAANGSPDGRATAAMATPVAAAPLPRQSVEVAVYRQSALTAPPLPVQLAQVAQRSPTAQATADAPALRAEPLLRWRFGAVPGGVSGQGTGQWWIGDPQGAGHGWLAWQSVGPSVGPSAAPSAGAAGDAPPPLASPFGLQALIELADTLLPAAPAGAGGLSTPGGGRR